MRKETGSKIFEKGSVTDQAILSELTAGSDISDFDMSDPDIAVITDNISKLNKTASEIYELKYLQLCELSRILSKRLPEVEADRVITLLGTLIKSDNTKSPTAYDRQQSVTEKADNTEYIAKYLEIINNNAVTDRSVLCRLAAEQLTLSKDFSLQDILGFNEPPEDTAIGRIACFENIISEKAFAFFSEIIEDPKVMYLPSYREICEAVYNGTCEYCIIPLYGAEGERLHAFYSLIYRYELKIYATGIIEVGSENNTVFALMKKSLPVSVGEKLPFGNGGNMADSDIGLNRLEIMVPGEAIDSFIEILRASEFSGLRVLRVDTSTDEGNGSISIQFDISNAEIVPFLIYLTAYFHGIIVTGLYFAM